MLIFSEDLIVSSEADDLFNEINNLSEEEKLNVLNWILSMESAKSQLSREETLVNKFGKEDYEKNLASLAKIELIKSKMGIRYHLDILDSLDSKELIRLASFHKNHDLIIVEKINQLSSVGDYLAIILHEICHATGHETRLNRLLEGDEYDYAVEELRAEYATAQLVKNFGISSEFINNRKNVIDDWLRVINNDQAEVVKINEDVDDILNYLKDLT